MQGVQRFEDLVAWQKARCLTAKIYAITKQGEFAKDFRFAGQMQGAAVSIMSNIAEGFVRGSTLEFHRFVQIAKASCAELRSQLYVALDNQYLSDTKFNELMILATEVGKVL